jgi:hypothetical protein
MFSCNERYVDSNGEFLIELRLSNARTRHESDLLVSADDVADCHDYDAMEVDSKDFIFGVFNWKVSLKPQPLFLLPLSTTSSWAAPLRKALQHQVNSNWSTSHH